MMMTGWQLLVILVLAVGSVVSAAAVPVEESNCTAKLVYCYMTFGQMSYDSSYQQKATSAITAEPNDCSTLKSKCISDLNNFLKTVLPSDFKDIPDVCDWKTHLKNFTSCWGTNKWPKEVKQYLSKHGMTCELTQECERKFVHRAF